MFLHTFVILHGRSLPLSNYIHGEFSIMGKQQGRKVLYCGARSLVISRSSSSTFHPHVVANLKKSSIAIHDCKTHISSRVLAKAPERILLFWLVVCTMHAESFVVEAQQGSLREGKQIVGAPHGRHGSSTLKQWKMYKGRASPSGTGNNCEESGRNGTHM